jgi:hypothetical protein
LASNQPEIALYYVARVVSGQDNVSSDNSPVLNSKPALPLCLHTQTHLLLCQILFSLCHSVDFKVSESTVRNIQEFTKKHVPRSQLDIFRLTKEMVVDFCSHVVECVKISQASLASPAVAPFSKIYYPIDDDQQFNAEQYRIKIDYTKLCLLRLAFTQMKLAWSIASINPAKFIDLYKEGSLLAIKGVAEALGLSSSKPAIPKEYLLCIADHLSQEFQTTSLVNGILDYKQYALLADMVGFMLTELNIPELGEKLRISAKSMLPVREGLIQASKTLLLMNLNVCEDCFFKLHTSNVYFERHSQGSGIVIPCPHGFVLI